MWVFCGLLLPVLLGLAGWQLQRAAYKQQQLDLWQQGQETRPWGTLDATGLVTGQAVTVDGVYAEPTWLLDNRTRDGVAGYEVLTLFAPVSGVPVVVNRGWVPAPAMRSQLPVLPQPAGQVRVTGRLSPYPEPPVLARTSVSGAWPRRVQTLTRAAAQAESSGVAALVLRLADSGQPGAFRADWTPDRMGPQTHYGYAVQWLALAIVLLLLTVRASFRPSPTESNNDHTHG
ncbi:SURF1 family protein [Marinobacter sp. X15-166B]|uniref:SURF1 family protein n=1 Tax=Marinobacter sp. X15-166B TaxID=1897620 RepID=UPI002ADFFE4F|nr:SURF1 family protein [Marinobacter sp. X15-166B]